MNKFKLNMITDVLVVIFLIGGGFLLLRPFSPRGVEGAFFGVKFVDENGIRYLLAGDEFSCEPIEDLPLDVSCQTDFEGQTLSVRLRYQDQSRRFLSLCWIDYGETTVDCSPGFGYESQLPFVVVEDNLGVSEGRFAELRAERPLLNWSEATWIRTLLVVAVGFAIITALLGWFQFRFKAQKQSLFPRVFFSFAASFVAYFVLFIGGNMLIGVIFSGPNAPYGLAPIGALVGTILVFVYQWRVRGGWQPTFGRIVEPIARGSAVLAITYFFGLFALLALGFVD